MKIPVSASRLEGFALVGTLVVAAILRGWGVTEHGLLSGDEGLYSQGVKTYSAVFAYLWAYLTGGGQEGLVAYFTQHGGTQVLSDRPTFIVLGFLASLVLGVHDYTLIAVSALFGVLTVFCVYQVGKLVFGRAEVGLAGALLLAVSPLHIAYSRTAYSDVTAAAVAWLAAWIYLLYWTDPHRHRRCLMGSALLVGLVFTIHPSLLWLPLLFLLLELWRSWQAPEPSSARLQQFKTAFTFTWLAALPTVLWEIATRLLRLVVFSQESWASAIARESGAGQLTTFLESAILVGFRTLSMPALSLPELPPTEYGYYLNLLMAHDGVLLVVLSVIGLLLTGFRWMGAVRMVPVLLIGLLLLIPMALNSFLYYYPKHPEPRLLLVAMPALVLFAAIAIVEFLQRGLRPFPSSAKTVGVAVVTVVIAGFQGPSVREVLAIQSAYPQAVSYMAAREGTKHITDHMFVARVYVGRQNAIDHYVSLRASDSDRGYRHVSLSKLREFYNADYRYFVRGPGLLYENELVRLTGGSYLLPGIACPQPVPPVFEAFHPQGEYWPPEIRHSERDAHIPHNLRVYLLKDLIDRLESGAMADCG